MTPTATVSLLLLVITLVGSLLLVAVSAYPFHRNFYVGWGADHARLLYDGELLTLSLDKASGSGFQSKRKYLFAKIDMQIKLVPGNSAGTVTAFYLASHGRRHDEIDFEFLGNLSGDPHILHTNIFCRGKGKREQQFYLWFDPTADFHNYTILWNSHLILFLVDDIPVRVHKKRKGIPFPQDQPMRVYSSIWNADDWATMGGLVKTNWSEAPFIASYKGFEVKGCVWHKGSSRCNKSSSNKRWLSHQLDYASEGQMKWVQNNYMIYNYCADAKNSVQGFPPPECNQTSNN